MAREAIVSVKDVETKARKVEQAAKEQANIIIESARKEVDQYEKHIMKEAGSKSRLIIGIAKSQAKKRAQDYLELTNDEFAKLDEVVKHKRREAIKLILEQVV